jgi:hypothetical protein
MLSTFVNLLQGSTYQRLYIYKYFHDVTISLQIYILMMSWVRIDFCGTRLRSWSFPCIYFFASHICPCIVSFYTRNTNFAGHEP